MVTDYSNQESITVLDKPMEVDVGEWIFSHPDCDSIVEFIIGKQSMFVFAYAKYESGNDELQKYRGLFMPEKRILKGVSRYAIAGGFI